jgi:hypothetical protein
VNESIFGSNLTVPELDAQITSGTQIGEIFSVMIERKAERQTVSYLLNREHPKFQLVAFYTNSVQLRRIA